MDINRTAQKTPSDHQTYRQSFVNLEQSNEEYVIGPPPAADEMNAAMMKSHQTHQECLIIHQGSKVKDNNDDDGTAMSEPASKRRRGLTDDDNVLGDNDDDDNDDDVNDRSPTTQNSRRIMDAGAAEMSSDIAQADHGTVQLRTSDDVDTVDTDVDTKSLTQSTVEVAKLDLLPSKPLQTILECLDVPARELYILITTIKPFYNAVQSRPDIVVKNAYLSDGNPKRIISDVVTYIKDETIHVPSAMRLLRLVNATRCERGDECFRYNLISDQSALLSKKEQSRRPFGLSLCDSCVKAVSVRQFKLTTSWQAVIPDEFDTEGVVMNINSDRYDCRILRTPINEKLTGARVGSILDGMRFSQMTVGNPLPNWGVEEIEREMYRAEMSKKIRKSLDLTIETSSSHDKTVVDSIVTVYNITKEKSTRTDDEATKEFELEGKSRSDKSKEVFQTIKDWLNELGKEYNWLFEFRCDQDPSRASFKNYFIDQALGPLVRAPKSITKQKMAKSIMKIVQTIEILEQATFLPLPGRELLSSIFLPNHYERALIKYYQENYKSILINPSHDHGIPFIRLVLSGHLLPALEVLVDFSDFFVSSVSSEDIAVNNGTKPTKEEKSKIARAVERYTHFLYGENRYRQSKCTQFKFLRSKYIDLLNDLEEFRNSSVARGYIEGHYLPTKFPLSISRRQEVVDSVFAATGITNYAWPNRPFARIFDLSCRRANEELLLLLVDQYNDRQT